MARVLMFEGHPVSPERYALLTGGVAPAGPAPVKSVATGEVPLTPAQKRAATIAAKKAAAEAGVVTAGTDFDAEAAKDLGEAPASDAVKAEAAAVVEAAMTPEAEADAPEPDTSEMDAASAELSAALDAETGGEG